MRGALLGTEEMMDRCNHYSEDIESRFPENPQLESPGYTSKLQILGMEGVAQHVQSPAPNK